MESFKSFLVDKLAPDELVLASSLEGVLALNQRSARRDRD
jgi:hypothetical protein